MNFKTFCENAEIEFTLFVEVNGTTPIKITTKSLESLEEELYKVNRAIKEQLEEQYIDLEESEL